MDVSGYRFQDPLWLWAVLLGPLVLATVLWKERTGRALSFPGASVRLRGTAPGWRARLRHVPAVLVALGLSVGAVALARPQHGTLKEDVTTQGVDIVVALDVSGSMAAQDFQPRNRLVVAKDVVAKFVERRTQDRVGLVVFAGKSLTKAPPTTDTAVLLRQLDDVRLEMLPDGTAIGSGLATSLSRLRHSKAKSRVVVLVTDGANNAGEIDPKTAADLAKAMEVRVYTVLVGRGGQVPMPVRVRDPFTGQIVEQTAMTEVQIDEELLKGIAERTSGEFFRATDPESLRQIFARIDTLETSEIKQKSYRRYRELFFPVLVGAFALLLAAGSAYASGLRVAPA
jgi:Ca-activated chloride channel family protein